jgi:Ca-activated chloride channel homolog
MQTQDFVANVESSVIHYGESTGFFADKMFNGGPSYLSAAVMYESLVVQANDGKTYPKLPMPVVAIYPKEGTFLSDHPYAVLQGSWVTAAKMRRRRRSATSCSRPLSSKRRSNMVFVRPI